MTSRRSSTFSFKTQTKDTENRHQNGEAISTFLTAAKSNSYLTLSTSEHTSSITIQPIIRKKSELYDFGIESDKPKRFLRFFDKHLDFAGGRYGPKGGVAVKGYTSSSEDENTLSSAITISYEKSETYLSINEKGEFSTSSKPVPIFVKLAAHQEKVVNNTSSRIPQKNQTMDPENHHQSGDAYDVFLKAVDDQSFIELSTSSYTAQLPVRPNMRKAKDSKLYDLESKSMEGNRFLRFFKWNDGMLSFGGEMNNPHGGITVQRYESNSCDAENASTSAITLFYDNTNVYLSINEHGMIVTSKEAVPLHVTLYEEVAEVDPSVLSEEDLEHFKTKGYVILKNAIPREYLDAARKNINGQMGEREGKVDAKHFPLDLRARILNKSPIIWSALNILMGPGNVDPWEGEKRFQLAVKFPRPPYDGQYKPDKYRREYGGPGGKSWHIDCAQCLCPFTLLVGVALSDQIKEGSGCLYVYPGQHLSEALRDYKADCMGKDKSYSDESDHKPNLGRPVPVFLEAGDVVLAHQSLPHTASINVSDDIRYQMFYRVQHAKLAEVEKDWLEDPMKCFMV